MSRVPSPWWGLILLTAVAFSFFAPLVISWLAIRHTMRTRKFQYTILALWVLVVAVSSSGTFAFRMTPLLGCFLWPMPLWVVAMTLCANLRSQGPVSWQDALAGAIVGSLGYALWAVPLRALEVIANR
jgi:hypothetical protein